MLDKYGIVSLIFFMAIDVTTENFQSEVVEKSATVPVLVDFWAEWCGPCRMLGPVLDKVEKTFAGRFILAKLDTDKNQKIAGEYRISGIPAVKLFIQGKVVDEFTGAMSEPNVLKFLEKNIPDPDLEQIMEMAKTDSIAAAMQIIEKKITGQTAEGILWQAVKDLLVSAPDLEKVKIILQVIPEFGSPLSDSRNTLLQFLATSPADEDLLHIKKVLSETTRREALDYFLSKVENASSDRELEKKALLSCFYLVGTTEQIVNEYRKKLAALIF